MPQRHYSCSRGHVLFRGNKVALAPELYVEHQLESSSDLVGFGFICVELLWGIPGYANGRPALCCCGCM